MRLTFGEKGFQFVLLLFITALSMIMVYPFVHEISISFSTATEALRPGLHWFPHQVSLYGWSRVLGDSTIWQTFSNTVFRTVVGTLLTLLFMSLGAYPLSKKYLPHRGFYTMFILVTMFIGGGLIPTYLLVKSLGLIDSRWALIIPGLISTYSMLILRNFFMSIPAELEESAKMDGATDVRILFSLIIPLSKPVLATLALWTAVGHWNAWFDAMIYMTDPHKMVLQTFLRNLVVVNIGDPMLPPKDEFQTADTVKAAAVIFTSAPILIVYPFLQRYFVKGMTLGAVKS